MNTGVHVSFQIRIFSTYMPRSRVARSYGNSIFSFLRKLHAILHSDATIYIPSSSVGGFPFSTPSSAFVICRLFRRAILSSGGGASLHFWFAFLKQLAKLSIFHVPVGHLYVLWRSVCLGLLPFFEFFSGVVVVELHKLLVHFRD